MSHFKFCFVDTRDDEYEDNEECHGGKVSSNRVDTVDVDNVDGVDTAD